MRIIRPISRRSFLAAVGGLPLAACATRAPPIQEDLPNSPPAPRHVPDGDYGRQPPTCADGDLGRHSDLPGRGRHCRHR